MADINFNDTYDELSNLATDTDNMVKSDEPAREKLDYLTVAKNKFGDLIADDSSRVFGYKNIDEIALGYSDGSRIESKIPRMIRLKTGVDLEYRFGMKGEMSVKDANDLTYEEQKKLITLIEKVIVPFKDIKKHCPEFDFKIGLHQYYNTFLKQRHDLHIEVFVDEDVAAPALDKWPTIIMDYDRPEELKDIRDDLVKAASRDLEAKKETAKKAYERQIAKLEKQHQANVDDLELFNKLNLMPADNATKEQ